ncbi:MAG: hypothetical protein U9R21_01385 [Candidatus Thermoplasmatota archaeon]|nr:hypothetical protein [Candidatus Thermoplasmatota archaeon]
MKKYYIELGAIVVALLMMSTVTAVPQTHSKVVMDIVNEIEQNKDVLEEKLTEIFLDDLKLGGIIDFLIQLIMLIIQLVIKIIEIVQGIMGLINLIQNLINALTTLFQLVQSLIELIQDIFNPEPLLNF